MTNKFVEISTTSAFKVVILDVPEFIVVALTVGIVKLPSTTTFWSTWTFPFTLKSVTMFTFVLNVASLFTIKFWPIVIFFVISVFPVTFNNGPILAIVAFKVVISAVPVVVVSAFITVEVIFGTVKAPLIFTSLATDNLSFTLKSNISDLPIISKPSKPIILSLNSALLSTDKLPLSVTEFIKYDLDIITASPSTNNLFFIIASLFT